jgi:hypothetical protein
VPPRRQFYRLGNNWFRAYQYRNVWGIHNTGIKISSSLEPGAIGWFGCRRLDDSRSGDGGDQQCLEKFTSVHILLQLEFRNHIHFLHASNSVRLDYALVLTFYIPHKAYSQMDSPSVALTPNLSPPTTETRLESLERWFFPTPVFLSVYPTISKQHSGEKTGTKALSTQSSYAFKLVIELFLTNHRNGFLFPLFVSVWVHRPMQRNDIKPVCVFQPFFVFSRRKHNRGRYKRIVDLIIQTPQIVLGGAVVSKLVKYNQIVCFRAEVIRVCIVSSK